jgi:plastocyanin
MGVGMTTRSLFTAAAAVLILSTASCASGGEEAAGDADGPGTGTDAGVEVSMTDNDFSPDSLEVFAGEAVTAVNEGEVAHTFTVDELEIDETVDPGAEAALTIDGEPGEQRFYCKFHPDMEGTLTIQ